MDEANDSGFVKILDKIKAERGLDFSQYRPNVLARRILMRAGSISCANFEQYLDYLTVHPGEMDYLMDAMTINVTEFFRDEKVFEFIEKKIIPYIFSAKSKAGSNMVNVWSCGSSSGEEAYSVLMLIAEFLGERVKKYKLTIHGTDIDGQSLVKAREAVYEASQFRNLSQERRGLVDKYFYNIHNQRYWVHEEWPARMNFFYHDITMDAPLENIDLILCRNLFIYFDRKLQAQVLNKFYSALNKDGFLVLGGAESLMNDARDKFSEYDQAARVYRKK